MKWTWLNALAALSLLLAACGGEGKDAGQAEPTVTQEPLAPTDTVQATTTSTPPTDQPPTGVVCSERALVLSVVDGDTIHVNVGGGRDESVRYIGVDAPERGDAGFDEANKANGALVSGKRVCLEKDITDRDRFQRLLRYVWLDDGTLVNAALLAEGVAVISTYSPDVKYVESRYVPAQHEAQEKEIGIWAPAPATASPEGATPSGTQTGNCDPSYPGVCIPPPPPDLDCSDIPYRRFTVVGADPHRFDSDHDGVGCEGG